MSFVFDVPLLFSKNSDEITALLGSPEPITNLVTDGEQENYPEKDFKRGDWLLHVVFNEVNGTVVRFLLADESENQNKSRFDFLEAANLNANDSYATQLIIIHRHPTQIQAMHIKSSR